MPANTSAFGFIEAQNNNVLSALIASAWNLALTTAWLSVSAWALHYGWNLAS